MPPYNCIVVLGPTASGKTKLACQLAAALNGEIVSLDSRQIYKHLNIGTGKDLHEYKLDDQYIPYHLIDICDPNEQFYLHQFITELRVAFDQIRSKNKLPLLCGGTGLYLDALRKDFSFTQVEENAELREELADLSKEKLQERLLKFSTQLIKHVDQNSKKRLIRGIEVATQLSNQNLQIRNPTSIYQPYYIGIDISTEERKQNIQIRLNSRIANGLIEEVEMLLKIGLSHERLQHLGLEYKFVSLYLQGNISKDELLSQLKTAIYQFSKRQMTWFRKMEKEDVKIHWIKAGQCIQEFTEDWKRTHFS